MPTLTNCQARPQLAQVPDVLQRRRDTDSGEHTACLVDRLLPDITHGIQGTRVRAGIIKAATDHLGVTELNKKLLQVAARLQAGALRTR